VPAAPGRRSVAALCPLRPYVTSCMCMWNACMCMHVRVVSSPFGCARSPGRPVHVSCARSVRVWKAGVCVHMHVWHRHRLQMH